VAKKFYIAYKNFFDIHIENSTVVVIIISMLIMLVWVYIPESKNLYSKANVLEVKQNFSWETIIINWVEYKLVIK
jgi:hypothetical protein